MKNASTIIYESKCSTLHFLCYYHRKRHFFILVLDFTITSTVRLQNFRAHRLVIPGPALGTSSIGYYLINYDVWTSDVNGMKSGVHTTNRTRAVFIPVTTVSFFSYSMFRPKSGAIFRLINLIPKICKENCLLCYIFKSNILF
jgi:hypothetical protein